MVISSISSPSRLPNAGFRAETPKKRRSSNLPKTTHSFIDFLNNYTKSLFARVNMPPVQKLRRLFSLDQLIGFLDTLFSHMTLTFEKLHRPFTAKTFQTIFSEISRQDLKLIISETIQSLSILDIPQNKIPITPSSCSSALHLIFSQLQLDIKSNSKLLDKLNSIKIPSSPPTNPVASSSTPVKSYASSPQHPIFQNLSSQRRADILLLGNPVPFPLSPSQNKQKDQFSRDTIQSWSTAKIKAWLRRRHNPTEYYYRFTDPNLKHWVGEFTPQEKKIYLAIVQLFQDAKYSRIWGIFSKALPHRLGYQCQQAYVRLIKNGDIVHPAYGYDSKSKSYKVIDKEKFSAMQNELSPPPSKYNCLSPAWATQEVLDLERKIDSMVKSIHSAPVKKILNSQPDLAGNPFTNKKVEEAPPEPTNEDTALSPKSIRSKRSRPSKEHFSNVPHATKIYHFNYLFGTKTKPGQSSPTSSRSSRIDKTLPKTPVKIHQQRLSSSVVGGGIGSPIFSRRVRKKRATVDLKDSSSNIKIETLGLRKSTRNTFDDLDFINVNDSSEESDSTLEAANETEASDFTISPAELKIIAEAEILREKEMIPLPDIVNQRPLHVLPLHETDEEEEEEEEFGYSEKTIPPMYPLRSESPISPSPGFPGEEEVIIWSEYILAPTRTFPAACIRRPVQSILENPDFQSFVSFDYPISISSGPRRSTNLLFSRNPLVQAASRSPNVMKEMEILYANYIKLLKQQDLEKERLINQYSSNLRRQISRFLLPKVQTSDNLPSGYIFPEIISGPISNDGSLFNSSCRRLFKTSALRYASPLGSKVPMISSITGKSSVPGCSINIYEDSLQDAPRNRQTEIKIALNSNVSFETEIRDNELGPRGTWNEISFPNTTDTVDPNLSTESPRLTPLEVSYLEDTLNSFEQQRYQMVRFHQTQLDALVLTHTLKLSLLPNPEKPSSLLGKIPANSLGRPTARFQLSQLTDLIDFEGLKHILPLDLPLDEEEEEDTTPTPTNADI